MCHHHHHHQWLSQKIKFAHPGLNHPWLAWRGQCHQCLWTTFVRSQKKCQFNVSDLKPNVPISKPTFFSQGKYFLAIFWSQSGSVKSTNLRPDFGCIILSPVRVTPKMGQCRTDILGDPIFSELSHFFNNSLVTLRGGVISRGFALYMEGGVSERNTVWKWKSSRPSVISSVAFDMIRLRWISSIIASNLIRRVNLISKLVLTWFLLFRGGKYDCGYHPNLQG